MTAETIKRAARECGFELAGVAAAEGAPDFERYERWIAQGNAGAMGYLTDRRAEVRRDVRQLLPGAKSVICVGKLYSGAQKWTDRSVHGSFPSEDRERTGGDRVVGPHSQDQTREGCGIVSRYAWGEDYHRTVRANLEGLAARLQKMEGTNAFEYRICVDTAPVLERSYARTAGLGWIGKNTCLISQSLGSWFFLGELITTLDLDTDSPPPERCGTCTRCIDACPTNALVPEGEWFTLDARVCISYLTIELRGAIAQEYRAAMGMHVFGCDICQDVCPWNGGESGRGEFAPPLALNLAECAYLSESEFHLRYRGSAIARPKYAGFLRNVAIAMGNSGASVFEEPLRHLASHPDATVAEHARWALGRLKLCEDTDSRSC